MPKDRELIIIGDRLLIAPDLEKERTTSGLYLPQGMATKEKIQSGYIIKAGPGYILPDSSQSDEPWESVRSEPKYVPLQVKEGDYAIFLQKDSIEIEYEEKKYKIVPQGAVLAVVRDHLMLS